MKSKVVNELKKIYGIRKIGGRKLEKFSFYELIHYLELAEKGETIKQ